MLNLYYYHDHPETLPLNNELRDPLSYLQEFKIMKWGKSIPLSDLEPVLHIIAKSASLSMAYANYALKRRWPEGENAIMRVPFYAMAYAMNVLAKDPDWPHKNGRWPEAEPHLMTDAWAAGMYASAIFKGRWPEAEPYIIKAPNHAVEYAISILANDSKWTSQEGHENGRWPEAEPDIMKDPGSAAIYAQEVLKARWEEAEPIIKTDFNYWKHYAYKFDLPRE